jgi:ADP-heptose:LPS heptosyltransferase
MLLQSLEGSVRNVFIRALRGFRDWSQPIPLPDWRARPYRVLFLRDDRVGDMIVSLAIIEAIAESSPTITLDVLASPTNAHLARGRPGVAEVLVRERGFWRSRRLRRELATRGYDAVIDARAFVGVNTSTTRILQATGARWRIGLAGRAHGEIFNVPIETGDLPHWIDYIVALARPFGVASDGRDWRPRLTVSPSAREKAEQLWTQCQGSGPRVLVNISAGHGSRRWPDDRWLALLQRLRERWPDARVAVLAMPSEADSANRLSTAASGIAPDLNLTDAIAMVATADLVLTPDTAISHISSAFRRPTLTLLRKDFERLVPYRTPGRNVFSDDTDGLIGLPASRAIRALDELLDER